VLGQVKFRQEKYDEALEALARAAKLDAQNAEIQNLLGLTLSQKGLRGPAETALRKAIQINPGYGEAHNNLAVIYLSQQPPLVELARWHYQKARAAGNPANPFLEKAFEARKTASTSP
jgi:Flp pilus assembly protein TadD